MLPAKWIRQADSFCLAQISPARRNGIRDEHKHLDRSYEKQICLYFFMEYLDRIYNKQICLYFFMEHLDRIYEKQICLFIFMEH